VIGRQVSHFYVIRSLGSGGMGTVYEAQDTRLPRSVAIKFLNAGLSRNTEAMRRFKREARLASSLNHPNICTVLEVDDCQGQSFIAMELLQGNSLKERLAAGPMSIEDILDVCVQVTNALAIAHDKGIMHRDVTPGNIFLTHDGLVKVLDFGLAKQFMSSDDEYVTETLTEPGHVAGTVHYMAPEQFASDAAVDQRCDLFSLGVVLYQMSTGSRPFQAKSKNEIISLICDQPHLPLRQLAPQQSVQLEAIVERLLAKRPENRYQTATALRADLDLLRGTRARRPPSSPLETASNAASVAVLPFEIVGASSPELEQFRDGLVEDVSRHLTEIRDLRVAPRTSTRRAINERIREIGKMLEVAMVVEGSVQQVGSRIKVIGSLINAASERLVVPSVRAAQRFDDVMDSQDAVAREIVAALMPALTRVPVTNRHTDNVEAYQAFKRGKQHWKYRFSGGWRTAIEHFQYAVECDERFALAHVALSDAYNFLGFYSLLKPSVAFGIARRAAERALQIDETLAPAHAELGLAKFGGDWDWEGSEQAFRRALQLDATYALGHVYYSWLLVLLGRHDAGLAEAEIALAQASSSWFLNAGVAEAFYLAHRYDQAIAFCDASLRIQGEYPYALHLRAACYRALSKHEEVRADLERAAALANRVPFYLGLLGCWYAQRHMRAEVLDILAELDSKSREMYVPPQCYVYIYAGLGDRQRALEYQEKAYEDGAPPLNYLSPFIGDLYTLDPHQKKRLDQMRLIL
jgi:serine/threonine protein kinase/tetratricopeptide (TPR) repeat protein